MSLPLHKYQHRRPVSSKSWNEQVIRGADTETQNGFAKLLTKEVATKVKVDIDEIDIDVDVEEPFIGYELMSHKDGLKENNSSGYIYKAYTDMVESFQDCIESLLKDGFIYSKTETHKNGATVRTWYYSTPNYFFYNLKYDWQAISKYLLDEQLDDMYALGEVEMPFTYEGSSGTLKIRYLDGKYVSLDFKDIYITREMNVKTDNKQLFTDRIIAIIKSSTIKIEADRYGITTATVRKWLKGSQPKDGKIREAIMKRGLRLVGEVITKQTIKAKVSPISLWDIAQFYNRMRLDTASKIYLGNEGKMETCFDGSKLDASKFGDDVLIAGKYFPYDTEDYTYKPYWDFYMEDILKYADLDAELCGQLARRCRNEYVAAGVRFRNPYSPANIGQMALMATGYNETINLIEHDDQFKRFQEFALESFRGGRFENSFGGTAHCVAIDLCSAYWLVLANLPSLIQSETIGGKRVETVNGSIVEGTDIKVWNEWIAVRNNFTLGFIQVSVEFQPANWYPLIDYSSSTLIAPRIFSGKIHVSEYLEMLKWSPIKVETGAFFYHEAGEVSYPFMEIITHCFDKKQNAKGSERDVWKQVGSSLYGKQIQAIDNVMGSMYNPIFAASITAETRSRLSEMLRLYPKCLMTATDGLLYKKGDIDIDNLPPRPICSPLTPKLLGEWEFEGEGLTCVIGSGVYSMILGEIDPPQPIGYEMVDYNPDVKHKTTYRGTAKSFILRSPHKDWFNFCKANADKECLEITRTRPLSLKEVGYKRRLSKARNAKDEDQEILSYDNVNIFKEEPLRLNPCTESNKRIALIRPNTFGDLLTNQYILTPHESVESANGTKELDLELDELMLEIESL